MLAQESDHVAIGAPDNVLDRRSGDLGEDLLLLDVEERDRSRPGEDYRGSTAVEDLVGLRRALDRLGQVVRQVSDLNVLRCVSAGRLA